MNTVQEFKKAATYYIKGIWKGLDEDHCFLFASGIAYNMLMCIIPISLVLFQILSLILQSSDFAERAVFHYIKTSLPIEKYGQTLQDWIQNQLSYVSHASLIPGIIALVVLLWLTSALFTSLRTAVNSIFKIPIRQNAAILKLKDIGIIFIVSFFMVVTLFMVPVLHFLRRVSTEVLPQILAPFIHSAFSYVIPITLAILTFLYLFHFLPHTKMGWRVSWVSTLVTVALLEIMKLLFTFYLDRVSNIGALYGAYAFLVAIAFWSYYVAVVFTIGAEAGKLYRDRFRDTNTQLASDQTVLSKI
jgi:membrane protein